MKQYRVELLLREFPFLKRLFVDGDGAATIWPGHVNEIKIRKGDKILLSKKGSEDSYDWSGGGYFNYTKYFAVWKKGEEEHIVELESAGQSSTGSGERREWDADPIGEQFFVRNIVPDYIVECIQNDTDSNGNGVRTRFWTIFKMKRFDLAAHHREQTDRAAAVLKAEIAAACA